MRHFSYAAPYPACIVKDLPIFLQAMQDGTLTIVTNTACIALNVTCCMRNVDLLIYADRDLYYDQTFTQYTNGSHT